MVWSELGTPVYDQTKVLFKNDGHGRTFFIYGGRLNLLEMYEPNNTLREIYLNATAPMEACGEELLYIDLELDISKKGDKSGVAMVVDENECEEAVLLYNYSAELVVCCWSAARLGQEVADSWEVGKAADEGLHLLLDKLKSDHV